MQYEEAEVIYIIKIYYIEDPITNQLIVNKYYNDYTRDSNNKRDLKNERNLMTKMDIQIQNRPYDRNICDINAKEMLKRC